MDNSVITRQYQAVKHTDQPNISGYITARLGDEPNGLNDVCWRTLGSQILYLERTQTVNTHRIKVSFVR